MDGIDDIDIRVPSFCWFLISNEASYMFLNCLTCDFNWYNTIVPRQYFNGWFNNTYCCLLFTVSCVDKEFFFLLYITVLALSQVYEIENFFWTSIQKIISVSSNLFQIMKSWVNVKSAILRCSTIISRAVIGKTSAVFNLAAVCCIGVLKLLTMCWYVEHQRSRISCSRVN